MRLCGGFGSTEKGLSCSWGCITELQALVWNPMWMRRWPQGAHLCVCFASKALMEALPSLNRIFLGEVRVVVQSFLFISSYVTPPRRLSALKIAANPCRFHFKVSILSLLVS